MDALRECGHRHLGVCWTERAARWLAPHGRIPPEYGTLTRRQIEEFSNREIEGRHADEQG